MSDAAPFRKSQGGTRKAGLFKTVAEIGQRFFSDRCPMMSASIAFYSAFSLAPTLLMVLSIAGWFLGRDAARGKLFAQMQDIVGNDAATALQNIVGHARPVGGSGATAAISIALLVVGASATFSSLNTALNVVLGADPKKGFASFFELLRNRLLSFGLVMSLGFLLVVTLVLDTAIQIAAHAVFGSAPLVIFAIVVQSIVGLLVLGGAFAAMLKWLPDTPVRFRHALTGAIVAAVLFTGGRHLFGFYLSHAGAATAFGAAGSLGVLMMWLYFSAVVFLLGAEVTAALKRAATPIDGRNTNESQQPARITEK